VPDFLDSNILVYAYDANYPEKRRVAQELLRRAVAGEFATSVQVLTELAATLLQRFVPPVSPQDLMAILDRLAPIRLIKPDGDMVRRAVEAREAYGVHFYDGMIIAAAERAGSEKIWSEDLNPGQKYFGVTVVNPFG
jgi:predicted nucleic acid-binding protein